MNAAFFAYGNFQMWELKNLKYVFTNVDNITIAKLSKSLKLNKLYTICTLLHQTRDVGEDDYHGRTYMNKISKTASSHHKISKKLTEILCKTQAHGVLAHEFAKT